MATSNNTSVDVAKLAYDMGTADEFSAWLDANPDMHLDKDGKPKLNKAGKPLDPTRRVASWSANAGADKAGDADFWLSMHHPRIVGYKSADGKGYDADLSLFTRYAIGLALAEARGELSVPDEVGQTIMDGLLKARQDQRDAQADRMKGIAGANTEAAKANASKASILDKLLAAGKVKLDALGLSEEELAALGQS